MAYLVSIRSANCLHFESTPVNYDTTPAGPDHPMLLDYAGMLSAPGGVPGSSRGRKEEEGLWAVRDCRDRSSSFRAAKRATNHVGSVRQGRGHERAQKVEQPKAVCVVRAAKAAVVAARCCECGLGSRSCRSRCYGTSRGTEAGMSQAR
ncbi:Uncharacterized protein HZ326_31789, partial [Fusarium oxysporum f. sp. albedinis]